MEDFTMTLTKLSNNFFPSVPSIFDRFFDGDLMDWNRSNYSSHNSTLPAINIKESANAFSIELAAPGMKKENFAVNYDNGQLTISSEFKNEAEEKEGEKITRREFNYQSFQRSFSVSEALIEAQKITAEYKNGILYIDLPKREEVIPKPPKVIKIS
jgi:HSP20 family protein